MTAVSATAAKLAEAAKGGIKSGRLANAISQARLESAPIADDNGPTVSDPARDYGDASSYGDGHNAAYSRPPCADSVLDLRPVEPLDQSLLPARTPTKAPTPVGQSPKICVS